MIVLGIETSCDETAVAILDGSRSILSNKIASQIKIHEQYGGVVPELAARYHLQNIEYLCEAALQETGIVLGDVNAIAVTRGPGLVSSLLIGLSFAKSLAYFSKKTLIAINHLEGHILSVRLANKVNYPYLCLLMSGGHCQLIWVYGFRKYYILGQTLDDSIGECFDKVARMLGLPYPGGPAIELHARDGDKNRFFFPRVMCHSKELNLSFSGLKTAVHQQIKSFDKLTAQDVCDFCASFQRCVQDIIAYKMEVAIKYIKDIFDIQKFPVVAVGGVAANQQLRDEMSVKATAHDCEFLVPPQILCTDNAAMIAWVAVEMLNNNIIIPRDDDMAPLSRWSLDSL